MKTWAFVSDFDGTISKKDFYHIVIEKYYQEGHELFKKWKAGDLKDIEFLSKVFTSINQEETTIIDDILAIPIDDYVPAFIKNVQANGGTFYILSAGTNYYIEHILKKYQIDNVEVFSNEGSYRQKNLHLSPKATDWHYSERYGIDKTKVLNNLKEKHGTIYFAGDSEPDSHPAVYADITFAKNGLQDILHEKNVPYVPVETFHEIEVYLKKLGVMK